MEVERYSHVMHIVSTVSGNLQAGPHGPRRPRRRFPRRDRLRRAQGAGHGDHRRAGATRRGPYAGATGYYGVDGRLDTCITLRTAILKDGVAYFQAGGGVVADSVPALEYEESRNKARAMSRALEVASARELWL